MITGETEVYGIFGYPVKHSKSPVFQNSAFSYLNINAVYVPFEVKPEELEKAVEGLKALNIKGVNITIPHKEEVIKYVDELSEEVKFIKASNTIKNVNGKLYAYNTDAYGFITGLKLLEPNLTDKIALVIGAGGASRAVIYSLLKENIKKVILANRNIARAENLRYDFKNLSKEFGEKINIINIADIENNLTKADIVVNTTPVGLKDDDKPIFNYDKLEKRHIVVDIVYKKTPLLQVAEKKGCKWQDGYPMLIYQGAKSFEIWTGKEAPIDVMKKALGIKF